jgi:peptidyl-prolyl cis-trans isomerase D
LSGVVYNQATGKNDTLPGFRTTANIDFVNSNSDVPYDSTYIAKKDLPAVDADKLFLQVLFTGRIFGKYYCISKSLGMKSGVNAKASHILIGYEGSQVPNQKKKNERGSES